MSKEKYCELIDRICAICNIPDSKSKYEGCHLKVEGTPVSLFHGGPLNERYLVSFCDFGEIPTENEADFLRAALETNMMLIGNGMPHFVVNPETRHLLLVSQTPLQGLMAEDLLATLTSQVISSGVWRNTQFAGIKDNTSAPL